MRLLQLSDKIIERIWSKINQTDNYKCWNWKAGVNDKGYGIIHIEGHTLYAHRLVFCIKNNISLSSDIHVLHHCDNPLCCNPNHLFLGNQADNNADMKNKGRARGPSKYYEGEVFLMRKLYSNKISISKICKMFRNKYPSNVIGLIKKTTYKPKEVM